MTAIVADASPLIAFQQIDQLGLLKALLQEVLIPPAVAREITPTLPPPLPAWIQQRSLRQPQPVELLHASLGAGEREALALAHELKAARLIIDDRQARRLAHQMGIPMIGTLGLLLAAKRKGYVEKVTPSIESLLRRGFRVDPPLLKSVLRSAGEAV